LQLATHSTLHTVHPRAVAASGVVQDVSIHVVQSAPHSGFIRKKNCTDLFIVFCFPDTNVAGLDNYVALKLDLRTVGVDGYYVHTTGKSVCGLMGPTWFPKLSVAYLRSWARKFTWIFTVLSCLNVVTSKVP